MQLTGPLRLRTPRKLIRADLGPDNRLLQEFEMYGLVSIYWPGKEQTNAVRVAQCESGWWTGAHATEGEDSRGIFQINVNAWPGFGEWNLYDPQVNCYFAYQIWQAQGWGPWTCAHKLGLV